MYSCTGVAFIPSMHALSQCCQVETIDRDIIAWAFVLTRNNMQQLYVGVCECVCALADMHLYAHCVSDHSCVNISCVPLKVRVFRKWLDGKGQEEGASHTAHALSYCVRKCT